VGRNLRKNLQELRSQVLDAVHRKLEEAILYIEHNRELVKSITSVPYIVRSTGQPDLELVLSNRDLLRKTFVQFTCELPM
jgi:hypothetical protein